MQEHPLKPLIRKAFLQVNLVLVTRRIRKLLRRVWTLRLLPRLSKRVSLLLRVTRLSRMLKN
nr:MAG TPA: hypothetical protein [Caudoviricetes sp.]